MKRFLVKADVYIARMLTFEVDAEDDHIAEAIVLSGRALPQEHRIEVDMTKEMDNMDVWEVTEIK